MGLTVDYRFGWLFHNHVGADLVGFTSTRIPFAAADGSLTESANLTWDGTTLDVHGYNCAAAIFRSNNYQSADGSKSIIYNAGTSRWYVSDNLGVSGLLDISGATTLNSSNGDNDFIIYKNTAGTAYQYDASANIHYVDGDFRNIINSGGSSIFFAANGTDQLLRFYDSGDIVTKPSIFYIEGKTDTSLDANLVVDGTNNSKAAYATFHSSLSQYYGFRMRIAGTYFWNLGNFGGTANSFSLIDQVDSSRAIMTALSNGKEVQWKAHPIFNYAYEDLDFTIRKKTSGNAYKYDAGTEDHYFAGGFQVQGSTAPWLGTGQGIELLFDTDDGDGLGYVQAYSRSVAPTGYRNLRLRGSKIDYYGNQIFNYSNADFDFQINKNTSGTSFKYDAGDDETQIGTAGTNYTAIESDGTIEFNGDATVWKDIQFNIETGRTSAANYPDWDASFTTNTGCYKFDVNDYIDIGSNEMQHDWQEGSLVYPHVHIALDGANTTGSSRFVKFIVYVAYADVNEAFTETSKTIEIEIPNGTVDLTHLLGSSASLDFTGVKIGSQVNIRLKRIAATAGTEYPNHIFVTQFGIHYLLDTVGSRSITTK